MMISNVLFISASKLCFFPLCLCITFSNYPSQLEQPLLHVKPDRIKSLISNNASLYWKQHQYNLLLLYLLRRNTKKCLAILLGRSHSELSTHIRAASSLLMFPLAVATCFIHKHVVETKR